MFRIITCLIFTNKISRVSAHSESDLEGSELIGSFFFAFNEFWISPCFKKNFKKPAKTQRKTNQTATNKSKLQQCSSYVHTIKASAPLALFLYEKPPRVSSSPSISGPSISSRATGHLPEILLIITSSHQKNIEASQKTQHCFVCSAVLGVVNV